MKKQKEYKEGNIEENRKEVKMVKSWLERLDEGTKKGLYFSIGALLTVISVSNFNEFQTPSFFGILLGMFFIVKALS